jgi:uncharacterized membrane protein
VIRPLDLILALLLVATSVAGFILVPAGANLPVHWGLTGEADGFLPRDAALLVLPVTGALTVGLLLAAPRMTAARPEGGRYALAAAVPLILGLFLVIQAAIVMIGIGIAVDMVRLIVLALGVLFAVLGNIMPKTQPNGVAGVRLPWTMRDPANWSATNRLAGLLLLLGGVAMVLAALATGRPEVLLAVTLAAIVVPVLAATIFSYRFAHRSS